MLFFFLSTFATLLQTYLFGFQDLLFLVGNLVREKLIVKDEFQAVGKYVIQFFLFLKRLYSISRLSAKWGFPMYWIADKQEL